MEKRILKIATLFALIVAAGCSPKTPEEQFETATISPVAVFSGTIRKTDSDSLTGSGKMRFTQGLNSASSTFEVDIDAELQNNGSGVWVISHADTLLNGGLQLAFLRSGVGLQASIQVGTSASLKIHDDCFLNILPNRLALHVRVSNSLSSGMRVMIWDAETPISNRIRTTALFDSTNADHFDLSRSGFPTVIGTGTNIGLRLENAVLRKALLKD